MRLIVAMVCAALLFAGSTAVGQTSDDRPTTPSQQNPPCKAPKIIFKSAPLPPDSWAGKAPKSAMTRLELTIDKKGKVKNPVVVQSGGKDVDSSAMDAVRQWRFTPAACDAGPIETKIQVEVEIHLR